MRKKREKKKIKICPYLETSHSRAILYYNCKAVEESELRVKPEDMKHYPCFTLNYRNCRKYKDARRGKCKK